MASIPFTAGAVGLCNNFCSAELLICSAITQGKLAGAYLNPCAGMWDQGGHCWCHLRRVVHVCLSLRTSLFSSWRASGDTNGSYNSRVSHGFAGESRAALKPPPLNAAIFGNTWRLGERIHVCN